MKAKRNNEGNNQVCLIGEIVSPFIFSHVYKDERIYRTKIKVDRLSKTPDILWLMLPESLSTLLQGSPGIKVMVCGHLFSYNQKQDGGSRLLLTISAVDIRRISESDYSTRENNQILLHGYVCKPPVYRITPLGREITEIILAVNRPDRNADYIPCIFWGRNARKASAYPVGKELQIFGRIQSREYEKQRTDDIPLKKVAYEVSVQQIMQV